METTNQSSHLPDEVIANSVLKLKDVFYETPDNFFDALTKIMISVNPTRNQFFGMINRAIFTLKKTKLTVADIFSGKEDLWEEVYG